MAGQATEGYVRVRMRFACCRYGVVLCTTYIVFFNFRVNDSVMRTRSLTFKHRASCILGQAFHYSPENAFYIFNQQIYFIM
jgi:vancomycin permeability regulator SanA